jgi:glutathione peroxidase
LISRLTEKGLISGKPNDIKWNFEKFLINKKGEIAERFSPDVEPNDPMIVSAIERELANA